MNLKLFDKRLVTRNIEKGLVTRAEYRKHLESLEDSASRCVEMAVSLFGEDKEDASKDAPSEPDEKA